MEKVEDNHDGTEIAEKRDRIANEMAEDEIFVHTVYNALKVPNANITEKLILAFSTIPETRLDFSLAKDRFINIVDLLEANGEVTSEEIILLKQSIKDINSLQELLLKRKGIVN
ncbi:MAG: hypothetical protein JSW11_08325 [Candidatus Heimdallarchaeota archaeon]|nr:MAG: hypothetical protein JSW11_08325 [Candidatus Heimdallarchaeota archaeon]